MCSNNNTGLLNGLRNHEGEMTVELFARHADFRQLLGAMEVALSVTMFSIAIEFGFNGAFKNSSIFCTRSQALGLIYAMRHQSTGPSWPYIGSLANHTKSLTFFTFSDSSSLP